MLTKKLSFIKKGLAKLYAESLRNNDSTTNVDDQQAAESISSFSFRPLLIDISTSLLENVFLT